MPANLVIWGAPKNTTTDQAMRKVHTFSIIILVVISLHGCNTDVQDQIYLPAATTLPVHAELPVALATMEGDEVSTVEAWKDTRKPEIERLFAHYMYGYMPPPPADIRFKIDAIDENYLDGMAIKKQVTITFGPANTSFHLLLVIPKDNPDPVPVFLGPNFHGNHAVLPDEDIPLSDIWQPERGEGVVANKATEASRGTSASRWSIDEVIARGYASATFYHGDLDPDYDNFEDGIHAAMRLEDGSMRNENSWGSLAAWAYGIHRAVDYLVTDPDIDPDRIAVMGHSRNGKAALWAGATDERIALVVSNQSGCGGAALSRRKTGETVQAINDRFPHWFNEAFRHFNDNEDQLPIDQHLLISLMAPRPVLVASAEDDKWADPEGEFLALVGAEPVYKLHGKAGLIIDEMPGLNQLVGAELGYHIRPGGHGVGSQDWGVFMDFADKFFNNAQ